MGDNSAIEWTDATWNPVTGCDRVSPGCGDANGGGCYAEAIAHRFAGTKAYPHGFAVTLRPERLDQPLRWTRPRRVFVNSMSDLFHDQIPDEYIARAFAVMALADRHTFQVLTKRHGRMRSLLRSLAFESLIRGEINRMLDSGTPYPASWDPERHDLEYPLPNVWGGVSAEDQKWADIRIPALIDTPLAVRFVSFEPLLGPVDARRFIGPHCPWCEQHITPATNEEHRDDEPKWLQRNPLRCPDCGGVGAREDWYPAIGDGIDWVIVGGESGPKARPMHPAWARGLRDQAQAAGVAYHFKQWGQWAPAHPDPARNPDGFVRVDGDRARSLRGEHGLTSGWQGVWRVGKTAGRELDGREWNEYPEVAR